VPTGGETIGLSFDAKPDRRLVELQGTMRLDRAISGMRSLDFRTPIRRGRRASRCRRTPEFARMRDGSWIISRWHIRMPSLALSTPSGRGLRGLMESARVAAIDLAGGDVFVARRGTDTLWSRPLPTVTGLITDSATGRAIAGARLRLRESGRAVYSDSAGRFDFGATLPGQYTLLTNTPSLDSVGAVSALALPVTETMASMSVRVPDAFRVLPAVCRMPGDSVAAWRHVGVVRGTVTRDSAVMDTSAITIVVQWTDSASKSVPCVADRGRPVSTLRNADAHDAGRARRPECDLEHGRRRAAGYGRCWSRRPATRPLAPDRASCAARRSTTLRRSTACWKFRSSACDRLRSRRALRHPRITEGASS
jgi:hypothetical protein